MIKHFIEAYYDFFDKKLTSSTVVVLIISAFVILVWTFVWDKQLLSNYKTSVLESSQEKKQENIITIDGKRYRLIFEEL